MKRILVFSVCVLILTAALTPLFPSSPVRSRTASAAQDAVIVLSDDGITVNGGAETDAVYTSHDIIYYQDMDTYPSGHPYGEGLPEERHSASEAGAHTVVNITAPGTYRVSGKLSAGQLRIDLGEAARYDPKAVVNLILDGADITCTVAPAILFRNTYECGGSWSSNTTSVDTVHAGANLILEGENTVTGSHVARIYKDSSKKKKLWKQDGAIQSCMSMNVDGAGRLTLIGDMEGLSSALHLTIQGGDIAIQAIDDGINASEDKASVITINNCLLRVLSGLQGEGDGIDSNGYLVINGGTIVAWTNPNDSPLDADKIFIHGGTVIALGSDEDAVRGDSRQAALYLTGYQLPPADSSIAVTGEDGSVILAYDPMQDSFFQSNPRPYITAILSCPAMSKGETYRIHTGASLTGPQTYGVYQQAQLNAPGTLLLNTSSEEVSPDFEMNKTVSYFQFEYPSAE